MEREGKGDTIGENTISDRLGLIEVKRLFTIEFETLSFCQFSFFFLWFLLIRNFSHRFESFKSDKRSHKKWRLIDYLKI